MQDIRTMDQTYVASTYGRFPVVIREGHGCIAVDENGKEYIDMGSGIGVNLFGYQDEVWKNAVMEQLNQVQHTSNLYYTEPCAALAERMCEATGMKKVFFCNSGAEANECAIKAARRYGELHKGSGAYEIITLENSFHGRTLTTLAATGQAKFHQLFQPLTPGFIAVKANDCEALTEAVRSRPVCAVMLECIQGEGGVNVLTPEFIRAVQQLAKENDLLVIDDEVQTGNGRTGKLYAWMNYEGFQPDIASTAKGLGGGLPIGATMLGEKVSDIFHPGDNGSTFGGNPVVCAGAIANFRRLDEKLLDDVVRKGKRIRELLEGAENVKSVSGMGLMIGIEPVSGSAAEIAAKCLEAGVLVLTAGGNRVRLLPPLNISDRTLESAADVIRTAFAQVSQTERNG
ncbi:MAG: aspartate aminotransferase family protein [Solobacterium sp.]|nr:aspartate aminotransferase family protein [Solobacterium sp.]